MNSARTERRQGDEIGDQIAGPTAQKPDKAVNPADILVRSITAIFGSYLLVYMFAAAAARLLPLQPSESTLAISLATIPLYTVSILWVFAARSSLRCSLTIVALSAILFVISRLG